MALFCIDVEPVAAQLSLLSGCGAPMARAVPSGALPSIAGRTSRRLNCPSRRLTDGTVALVRIFTVIGFFFSGGIVPLLTWPAGSAFPRSRSPCPMLTAGDTYPRTSVTYRR